MYGLSKWYYNDSSVFDDFNGKNMKSFSCGAKVAYYFGNENGRYCYVGAGTISKPETQIEFPA